MITLFYAISRCVLHRSTQKKNISVNTAHTNTINRIDHRFRVSKLRHHQVYRTSILGLITA